MAFYGDTAALSTTRASIYTLLGATTAVEYAQQVTILNTNTTVVYGGDVTVTNAGLNAAFILEEDWAFSLDSHDGRAIDLKNIYLVAASATPSVQISIVV